MFETLVANALSACALINLFVIVGGSKVIYDFFIII